MTKWTTDIKQWVALSESAAQLYISLAENKLDETVETAKNITDRSDKLLAINIMLITAILGFLTTEGWKKILEGYFNLSLLIMLFMLSIPLIFLIKNLFSYRIGTKGEEPKFILTSKFVDTHKDSAQYLNLCLQICETYQQKITGNTLVNDKRNRRLSWAIYIMLCLPLSFLISFVYLYWVQ